MKRFLKRCTAQILVIVFYATGMAYRTGNHEINTMKHLKKWADS